MPLIAGIDIGNATTEVALASDDPQARAFVASGIVATTGMKGTRDNIAGTLAALEQALAKTPWSMSDVSRIYLNEAAPVIGDVAMETITETIITESTMIGHNPQTPGGVGVGVGTTIALGRLATLPAAQYAEGWIVLIDDAVDFLDAGSTDAAIVNAEGQITAVHLAGAGNMVSLLIKTELGLEDLSLAEAIKKYPLAKVESLFSIRHENGAVEFFREALSPAVFAKVVYIKEGELVPIDNASPLEKIRLVRRQAKEKVFVTNCLRALRQVSPGGSIRDIAFVVLVGGSSLDFEIPQLITEALSHYGVVAGQGNIRGTEGPRNAVATGLLLAGQAN